MTQKAILLAAAALIVSADVASAQSLWGYGEYQGYSGYSGGAGYYDDEPLTPRPARRRAVKPKRKHDPAEARARAAPKPVGPLVVAVSIKDQRLKVYDANGLFAETSVSTGTRSHPTPAGVFSIIQKRRHHVSNLYDAEMPYMQRVTWSGIAMHTGALPGYAASHGCIRLPNEFAARLWTWTKMGTRVIVSAGEVTPAAFSHAKLVARMTPAPDLADGAAPAPVAQRRTAEATLALAEMRGQLSDASTTGVAIDKAETAAQPADPSPSNAAPETKTEGKADAKPETATEIATDTQPDADAAAPTEAAKPAAAAKPRASGHVAVFISRKDRKLYIRQGFEPIYETAVDIADSEQPLGTHVFTARGQADDAQALSWSVISIPAGRASDTGHAGKTRKAAAAATPDVALPSAAEALDRIAMPDEAQAKIAALMAPGGSLLISDQGLGWETGRGTDFIVPIR